MGRPLEFEQGERVHIGTKFNRHIAKLLEDLARRHGYNRTQALEFLVVNAIVTNYIPPRDPKINDIIDKMKSEDTENVVREKKDRLVAGKPGADAASKVRRKVPVDQGAKVL